jgi:hypothetical protein
MPDHMGIDGNETDGQLATEGASHPITRPLPAPGINAKVTRGVIMD